MQHIHNTTVEVAVVMHSKAQHTHNLLLLL